jgi:hypothetical protein
MRPVPPHMQGVPLASFPVPTHTSHMFLCQRLVARTFGGTSVRQFFVVRVAKVLHLLAVLHCVRV